MKIGVPKEVKNGEFRVAATPNLVQEVVKDGHIIVVEDGAGLGSGIDNEDFKKEGATIGNAAQAWDVDLVLKVKEPVEAEYTHLKEGLTLFSYLHLAGSPKSLTEILMEKRVTAIAMETVEKDGILNLAAPMSEVAGKIAIEIGSYYLQKHRGGKGVLCDDIAGVTNAQVIVIGAGTAGLAAAEAAGVRGAAVIVFETREDRRRRATEKLSRFKDVSVFEPVENILKEKLAQADIVVGAALQPGGRTPHIVSQSMVDEMEKGTVLVDISIDQGGCFETSKVGTHSEPTHTYNGIIHYAVPNMPGTFPSTATFALVNATTPYVKLLADKGLAAVIEDPGFLSGLATHQGKLFSAPVGAYFDLPVTDLQNLAL